MTNGVWISGVAYIKTDCSNQLWTSLKVKHILYYVNLINVVSYCWYNRLQYLCNLAICNRGHDVYIIGNEMVGCKREFGRDTFFIAAIWNTWLFEIIVGILIAYQFGTNSIIVLMFVESQRVHI